MSRIGTGFTAGLALLLAGGAALEAQEVEKRKESRERRVEVEARSMAPGHRNVIRIRTGGAPAQMLLHQRESLELTAQQVERLEALAARQRDALEPSRPDMLRAQADLLEATTGEIDIAAARAALERMARMQTDATVARLQARKDALDVLTPAQREKAEHMGGLHGPHIMMRRDGGMLHGPGGMFGPDVRMRIERGGGGFEDVDFDFDIGGLDALLPGLAVPPVPAIPAVPPGASVLWFDGA